ncbi:LUD domain-containing protein [Danxiaibacter flavus]|uniref:LUD domain-containing protein n=1 Tax=Danxiaibacter flavus TaxID=3049108 RepID=A0ABV3ZFH5_9BACT|nr:LUD domain-containing protein [Chitinophagaceae bacterium DXS]
MQISKAKENILKKIRQALSNPVPVPFPQSEGNDSVFQPRQQESEVEFAENFSKLQGRFSFCLDRAEAVEQLKALITTRNWTKIYCREEQLKNDLQQAGLGIQYTTDLYGCDASITTCEKLIARTGSIVLSSAQQSGRTVSVYAPVHICIAYTSQLVYDIKDALSGVKEKYAKLPSLITLATGPSRTADIEKTLVVGVHGPKEVFCLMIEG